MQIVFSAYIKTIYPSHAATRTQNLSEFRTSSNDGPRKEKRLLQLTVNQFYLPKMMAKGNPFLTILPTGMKRKKQNFPQEEAIQTTTS